MSKIIDLISSLPPEALFFSLEFFPPKTTAGFENLLPRLHRLRALQPLFVCITFSAGGSTASKSLELADVTQNTLNLPTCLHLTCTNMKRGTVDEVLKECKRLGIRNILALRGDEPRESEYALDEGSDGTDAIVGEGENKKFKHAVDLIRYIREEHGDYFCIAAAAYPEGHPTQSPAHPGGVFQSPSHDLPHLIEKVQAGADFLLTQLFYDVEKYTSFVDMLRNHESGLFDKIPIIPGMMPAQGWQSFSRTIKLARVGVPQELQKKFQALRGDDEGVKNAGVECLTDIVNVIKQRRPQQKMAQGFHFYTLNLEKAVAQILEKAELVGVEDVKIVTSGQENDNMAIRPAKDATATHLTPGSPEIDAKAMAGNKRRASSTKNRVVVSGLKSDEAKNSDDYVFEDEAGKPRSEADEDQLAIAEGEGSLGRAAAWDDFPNGRWGDARSPAYNSASNYALHPNLTPSTALALWSTPTTSSHITSIFTRHLHSTLPQTPWSDDAPSPETETILPQLLALNAKGWWTLASQPAVNGVSSGHPIFGWGPARGGFVYQKPFVEFFLPANQWPDLKEKLEARPDDFAYFAGNAAGEFEATDELSVNPVTWGAFKGKEIITPTIIEAVSFREWQGEAFGIWREWGRCFKAGSESHRLLEGLRGGLWLVCVIGQDFTNSQEGGDLWTTLLGEGWQQSKEAKKAP